MKTQIEQIWEDHKDKPSIFMKAEAKKVALSPKQAKFAVMVAKLIQFIDDSGFHVTFGEAYAMDGHMDNSLHYKRLAVDLNLFDSDYNWLTHTEEHKQFGEFWKSLGGTWGGDFTKMTPEGPIPTPDGNHYSLEHEGYK